jgi:hypothetical protein
MADLINEVRELIGCELDSVTGGMNLDNYRESTNVEDHSGGSSAVGAYIVYYDMNHHVSGYGKRY